MVSIPALVEPAVLEWARRKARLDPVAAARRIKVPDGRVLEWESGEVQPTIAQLRKASKVYRRSLAVFFLSEPPEDFDTLRDFRRVAADNGREWSAALQFEYQRAHAQRDVLLELGEMDGENVPTEWRIAVPRDDEGLAVQARARLVGLAAMPFPSPGADEYKHLNYWTNALEEAGILVMSTEGGRVPVDEMRAFSLYFDEIPVVVVNGADATRGRLFSMLHEYAHLLLHTEGLCDTTTDMRATTPDRQLEAQCNAIAAAILMPGSEVLQAPLVRQHAYGDSWSLTDLVAAARPFGVSAEAFLRRLVTLRQASLTTYRAFRVDQQSEAPHQRKPSGGNFYLTKARDLGRGYVRRVSAAHRRASIDSATAATYLGVKVGQIPELTRAAQVDS